MSPETKYFIADHLLKAIYKTHGHDHDRNTDGRCTDGQPDDEFRKGLLPVKGDSLCYEYRNIQTAFFWYLTKVFYLNVMIKVIMGKVQISAFVKKCGIAIMKGSFLYCLF